MTTSVVRALWIAVGSVVGVLMLTSGSFWAFNALARDTETRTSVYDGHAVRTVDIESENGSITVVGGDRDDLVVTATLTHGLRRTEEQVSLQGDRLVIRDRCDGPAFASFCRSDYTLQVPTDITAVLRNANGSILVTGLGGGLHASSSNGGVAASRVGGELRLHSANGKIEGSGLTSDVAQASSRNGSVDLAFADPPLEVQADTRNGSVEVVLPDTPDAYDVDASSRNGSVDTPVRTDPSSARTIVAESRNGSVTVRYPDG